MTDVVSDVKDVVEVEESTEKSELKEEVAKKTDSEKNGDTVEEKLTNGTDATDKSVENGDVKKNGLSEKETESKDEADGVEVCGIKRKSEVGVESDEPPVQSSEKKQKTEDTVEQDVADANGDC